MSAKLIYPERESKHLEFKSTVPKFQLLVKTCIAFANGSGGRIVIGIDDDTHEIIGITDKTRDKLYDGFPNSLYDAASPNLFAQIYEKNFNGKSVLIIEIPSGFKKPYFLKKEGIPNGVYLRVGSSTRRANQEYVEDLIREKHRMTYDEETIPATIDALSNDLIKAFYKLQPTKKRLLGDKLISPQLAYIEKYQPTVAGIILFCEEPQKYIPEATVICTRFDDETVRSIIQTEEISGNITKQIETTYNLLQSWLKRDYKLKGTKMKGHLPVPGEALREAIINALIHRKYSIPGATKIAVFSNRLEIFNPGCFPGLVDINNLGDGTTYLRNPVIARIAHKMGLIEKLGSGIRLIFDSCKAVGLKIPRYNEDGDFVKVTFRFELEKNIQKTDKESILILANTKKDFTINDVMNFLGVSRNTATRKLNKLIQEEKILRYGKGPSVRFRKRQTL